MGGFECVPPAFFAFGAGRNPVAAPPALAPWPRRVSGCAAWRWVPVASPRSGSRLSRGALEPRLTRGAPPSAASRRPPWMALRSVGGGSVPPGPVFLPCAPLFFALPRRPFTPLPSALPSGPGSGPGPAFRLLPRLLPEPPPPRPCPLVPRFPPQPPSRGGGAWAAGAGEGTVRVGRCHGEGVLGGEDRKSVV